jgi:hypothetical protein
MPVLKRLDTLEVATADLADAVATYQRNFGFELAVGSSGDGAVLKIGDAAIRLVGGRGTAGISEPGGEGLAALWLETDDLEQVMEALSRAGLTPGTIEVEGDRRLLRLDPKIANQVPLVIFDRRAQNR